MVEACTFVLTRGPRKGQGCGCRTIQGLSCCKRHTNKEVIAPAAQGGAHGDGQGHAPINLFYDLLPDDLQLYITRMPLVDQILENRKRLEHYETLENIRIQYFIPLNQAFRTQKNPYKDQTLLNHWCKIVREPLLEQQDIVPWCHDFMYMFKKRKRDDDHDLSHLQQLYADIVEYCETWESNVMRFINKLIIASGKQLYEKHCESKHTNQQIIDPLRFSVSDADLKTELAEQAQLLNVYDCYDNMQLDDEVYEAVRKSWKHVFISYAAARTVSSDFILKRKCLHCSVPTSSRQGYCKKCIHHAPPLVNLLES